jgi:hypothetical protein
MAEVDIDDFSVTLVEESSEVGLSSDVDANTGSTWQEADVFELARANEFRELVRVLDR